MIVKVDLHDPRISGRYATPEHSAVGLVVGERALTFGNGNEGGNIAEVVANDTFNPAF
jgi:hypothetical protein